MCRSVFISGSSKTQLKDSEYYRKKLPTIIKSIIGGYMSYGYTILVGDAPGIDRQVQDYAAQKNYKNVVVYGPGKDIRYIADESWNRCIVNSQRYPAGSSKWLEEKDISMSFFADKGLAIVAEGGSHATWNNVYRMRSQGKSVIVYQLSRLGEDQDKFLQDTGDIKPW